MATIKELAIPATRDPFVNTPLIKAGIDEKTGEERFFISTWNANVGCLSALITPSGKERIYRYRKGEGLAGCGAYSAIMSDNDTMWLCSDLSWVMRLSLSTGKYEYYATGARSGLVFSGMQYDPATRKIIFLAFAYPSLCAVSFDIERKKTVRIYDGFTKATLANGGFSNNDGTYTLRFTTERSSLYRWNPKEESLVPVSDINPASCCINVISDDECRFYVPFEGWLSSDGEKKAGPRPDREMGIWFGRINDKAYGAAEMGDGVDLFEWDLSSGRTRFIYHISNGTIYGLALSSSGEILAVTVFGEFYKIRASDGALLLTKLLDSNSQGRLDCLIRADDHHLLGTPFISQRFWLLDTDTNTGFDAGRAATRSGEVLRVWNINGRIYMASYTQGILTEFDMHKNANFPENPCIVAQAPNGMRPVTDAHDENCLYYSCNHEYGILGCVLTRYNTKTREAYYRDNPVPNQHIISLVYHSIGDCLLGSTTYRSDCDVTSPKSDRCYIVKIDKLTLSVIQKIELPRGTVFSYILGAINENRYLICLVNEGGSHALYVFDCTENTITSLNGASLEKYDITTEPKQIKSVRPGKLLTLTKDDVSVWRVTDEGLSKEKVLMRRNDAYAVFTDKYGALVAAPRSVYMIETDF